MKKRELLVFAGQSNMMGAAVFPPKIPIECKDSYEYKHKEKRFFGAGKFVPAAHPAGEFSYADLDYAYSPENSVEGKSCVNDYQKSAYFVSAISNFKGEENKGVYAFSKFSEADFPTGVSLPPLFAMEWERLGGACAYAHIAKGGVSIRHYFTNQMAEEYQAEMTEYNRKNGTSYDTDLHLETQMSGAAEYFDEKTRDFFSEAEKRFAEDDTSEHIFVWLQGESDVWYDTARHLVMLNVMWKKLKALGFTKFFMLRVDFFGNPKLVNIMRAQEQFCEQNADCFMMTRLLSFITVPTEQMKEVNKYLLPELDDCRDSFYGFSNWHINEKGFSIVAKKMAFNTYRVLKENLPPVLEEEMIPNI